jgi:hypothetical protein
MSVALGKMKQITLKYAYKITLLMKKYGGRCFVEITSP